MKRLVLLSAMAAAIACQDATAPPAEPPVVATTVSTPEMQASLRLALDDRTCVGRQQLEVSLDRVVVGRPWLTPGVDTSPAYQLRLGDHLLSVRVPDVAEWVPVALTIHRATNIFVVLVCG
jgi:hypothetical protein